MFVCKYYIIKWVFLWPCFTHKSQKNVFKFLFVFPVRLLLTQTHENDAYNRN